MKTIKNKTEKKQKITSVSTRKPLRKQFKGVIISDKMQKTAVVKVWTIKKHPLYQKRYHHYKKYFAHNKNNQYKTNDEVIIEETRPLSGKKRWNIISVFKK